MGCAYAFRGRSGAWVKEALSAVGAMLVCVEVNHEQNTTESLGRQS